jgi:hypothetical protein
MNNGTTTIENPVAINTQEEKRKQRLYEKADQQLHPKAMRTYDKCLKSHS